MPILQLIQDHSEASGNHCGLTVVEIAKRSGKTLDEVKEELNRLHAEKKIQVRDGAQGKLILIKTQ